MNTELVKPLWIKVIFEHMEEVRLLYDPSFNENDIFKMEQVPIFHNKKLDKHLQNKVYHYKGWKLESELLDIFPNMQGIYSVWYKNKCIYVGQSNNIKIRLSTHFHTGKFNRFSIDPNEFEYKYKEVSTKDIKRLNKEETEWIQQYKPILNIKQYGDASLRKFKNYKGNVFYNQFGALVGEYDGRGILINRRSKIEGLYFGISGDTDDNRKDVVKWLLNKGAKHPPSPYSNKINLWVLGKDKTLSIKKIEMIKETDKVLLWK